MKTNKLLSVVLTLCVLLAAFSLTALAADGETYSIAVAYCVEGDENGVVEEYAAENLQNAINEIAKTAAMFEATAVKMTLQADVTGVASTLTVPAGTEFTLDLAGHTLEGNNQGKDQAFLLVNGKLTLTDSVGTGKVCSTYTGTAGRVVSVVGGELTVAGGTITTEGMAKAGNAIYVSKGSTLSMTGGKVYADAKRGNYAIRIGGKDAIFTMTGGVAEADSSTTETYITAIDVSSTGTVTIGGDSVVRGPKALTTTSLTALTVTVPVASPARFPHRRTASPAARLRMSMSFRLQAMWMKPSMPARNRRTAPIRSQRPNLRRLQQSRARMAS